MFAIWNRPSWMAWWVSCCLPLELPARRNEAIDRTMLKRSCERNSWTLPRVGSGRCSVRTEPDTVRICCSLVPENCPTIAWEMAVGGWSESEYRNIFDVVAMVTVSRKVGSDKWVVALREKPTLGEKPFKKGRVVSDTCCCCYLLTWRDVKRRSEVKSSMRVIRQPTDWLRSRVGMGERLSTIFKWLIRIRPATD